MPTCIKCNGRGSLKEKTKGQIYCDCESGSLLKSMNDHQTGATYTFSNYSPKKDLNL